MDYWYEENAKDEWPVDERNATWESEDTAADAAFDPDATPGAFFFDVEGVGTLEPDQIVQEGIKVLQNKLAAIIQGLGGGAEQGQGQQVNGGGADDSAAATGAVGGATPFAQEGGFDGNQTTYGGYTTGGSTAYGGGGGGGGATSYGTPYGAPGQNRYGY